MEYRNCHISFSEDGYNLIIENETFDEPMVLPLIDANFKYGTKHTLSGQLVAKRLLFVTDSRTGERYSPLAEEVEE